MDFVTIFEVGEIWQLPPLLIWKKSTSSLPPPPPPPPSKCGEQWEKHTHTAYFSRIQIPHSLAEMHMFWDLSPSWKKNPWGHFSHKKSDSIPNFSQIWATETYCDQIYALDSFICAPYTDCLQCIEVNVDQEPYIPIWAPKPVVRAFTSYNQCSVMVPWGKWNYGLSWDGISLQNCDYVIVSGARRKEERWEPSATETIETTGDLIMEIAVITKQQLVGQSLTMQLLVLLFLVVCVFVCV